MLEPTSTYEAVRRAFRWRVPERFNIGVAACDALVARGAGARTALIYDDGAGRVETYDFARLKALSDRFANALRGLGVGRGDRVGILLGQRPETAIAHLAVYKLGAIAVPLFTLFGEDALAYRLEHSGARAVVTDADGAARLAAIRDRLEALAAVVSIAPAPGAERFDDLLARASSSFQAVETAADDPALIIYTSGTTGPPKGALHAHRVLLGHMPGVAFPHRFFPQPGDLFWTPADWAWIGGLLDVLLPAWFAGAPVLAHRARKFDPEQAFALMARHRVRNVFLPPTALKMMREVENPRGRFGHNLRSVGSGGETLGAELLAWGEEALGVTINEFYGQTEVNLVVANCADVMPVKPGSMGRAVPGHAVEVVGDDGRPVGAGTVGQIAVRRPDPVMFLEYWRNPQATAAKFAGEWCLTGDLARRDDEGYFHFVGREDDVITSAGYRIGPGEVEDCLMKHPAVAMAAVVGAPDPLRTEIVKAFVVLRPGVEASAALAREIQGFVRARLAAHAYPRAVAFVNALPLTATGKVMRRVLRERAAEEAETAQGA